MISRDLIKTLIGTLDLTSLNDSDDEAVIRQLCEDANNPVQPVAAVCVTPKFVVLARQFSTKIPVATVANFPSGEEDIETVLESVRASLRDGADEIDVVFPYQSYLRGEKTKAIDLIQKVKAICGDRALLKVILETGALPNAESIRELATAALQAGADFLKTSTGKTAQGATLDAARILLEVIRDQGGHGGIKISGGVRTTEQALDYYRLTQKILGEHWPKKETFRIGASSLLKSLLMVYDSFPLLLSE